MDAKLYKLYKNKSEFRLKITDQFYNYYKND